MKKQVWTVFTAFVAFAAHAQAPIPVEEFFKPPAVAEAHLSPTGRQLAVVVPGPEGKHRLIVTDTQSLKSEAVAGFPQASIANVHWVNDKRLVFSVADLQREWSFYSFQVALYAVDADGRDFRYLVRHPEDWGRNPALQPKIHDVYVHYVGSTWNQDSDEVYVSRYFWKNNENLDHVTLSKLDTRSGRITPFSRPGETQWWTRGPGDHPRMAGIRDEGGKIAMMWWDAKNAKWDRVQTYDAFTGENAFRPVGYGADDLLYVISARKGPNSLRSTRSTRSRRSSPPSRSSARRGSMSRRR